MPQLFVLPRQVALDDDANPYAGALLYFFQTGTETDQAVYSDSALTVPHSQPVTADAAGKFPKIYLDPRAATNYRIRLTSASGVLLDQQDDIDRLSFTSDEIGAALYPLTDTERDEGIVPTDLSYPPGNILRYGAEDGENSAAALQAAINSLPATGGEIFVPGGNFIIESAIDLAERRSIRIYGTSKPTAGAGSASILSFTQTSGSRCIDARSTFGVMFDSLMILQTGVGFTGHVIDYAWSAASSDSALGGVRDCYMQALTTCASLVNLHKAITMSIEGNHMVGADSALLGGGSDYANRINVINNEFKAQVTAPILNPGTNSQTWLVLGNTFEPKSNGGAAAVAAPSSRITGLVFIANWCGDATAAGVWITASAMDASIIQGNMLSTGAIAISVTGAFANAGNIISCNSFVDVATAVNVLSASSFEANYEQNTFSGVTDRLVGTISTGRVQTASSLTNYNGASQFSNGHANGVGGTISGTIWSVLTGAASNVGMTIKGAASQSAYHFQTMNSSDQALIGIGDHIKFRVRSDVSASNANEAFLFLRDNGAGKMQLAARFPSGAIQTIATEP
jgi:hypothetical protein